MQNAIKEVSKLECVIMGDAVTVREDQTFFKLVQDRFLSQHVLEPIRGEKLLDIVLSSQKEFVDNM